MGFKSIRGGHNFHIVPTTTYQIQVNYSGTLASSASVIAIFASSVEVPEASLLHPQEEVVR